MTENRIPEESVTSKKNVRYNISMRLDGPYCVFGSLRNLCELVRDSLEASSQVLGWPSFDPRLRLSLLLMFDRIITRLNKKIA